MDPSTPSPRLRRLAGLMSPARAEYDDPPHVARFPVDAEVGEAVVGGEVEVKVEVGGEEEAEGKGEETDNRRLPVPGG